MTTKPIDRLDDRVEQLIREHLATQRRALIAAIERAFAPSAASKPAAAGRPRASFRRRPPTEVATLAEKLFEVVRANPGETMSVIAPHVGASPRALNRPMLHLKRSGRVRSAGERHFTRYFPMTPPKA